MQAGLPTAILRGGRIVWLEKRPVRGSRAARAGGTRQEHQNYFLWPVVFNNIQLFFLVRRFPKGCQDISSPALNGGLRRSGEVSRSPNASTLSDCAHSQACRTSSAAQACVVTLRASNHVQVLFQCPNHGMAFLVQTLSGAFSCSSCAT